MNSRKYAPKNSWTIATLLASAMTLSACADNTNKSTIPVVASFTLTPATTCEDVEAQLVESLVEQALADRYVNYREVDSQNNASGNNSVNNAVDPPQDFTTTNVQEEGVDEADFMKTDGSFIYMLRGQELIITKSWPAAETVITGRLALPLGYASSMFLKGDRVAIFSGVYEYACGINNPTDVNNGVEPIECTPGDDQFSGTRVTLVDVSDRTAPAILRSVDIESNYANARMIGSDVYLVSNSYSILPSSYWDTVWNEELGLPVIDYNSTEAEAESARETARPILKTAFEALVASEGVQAFLPRTRDVDAGTASAASQLYACTDVYLPAQPTALGLLNITHFEIDDDTVATTSTGVLAGGWMVYASQQSLYVAMSSRSWWWGWGDEENSSHIHKFSLDGADNKARYAASGRVDGWLLNQFSMSEYEGHLRVATTDNEWIWNEQTQTGEQIGGNHVIVLKEDAGELVETGSIRDLAPGEQIYSARFLGNKGYVVTFLQTDPLFTFDLSDPTNPQLKGELKVNGFSSYIHPMGPDHLLTIGQDGTDTGQVTGVQLQIFDVSDLANPTRTYQHVLSTGPWSSWSEAMWEHHAFTYHAQKEILAIPLNAWEDGQDPFSGLVVLKASKTTGFEELGRVDHSDLVTPECNDCNWDYQWWVDIRRSVFIEDYLYSISDVGMKVNDLLSPAVEQASVVF